MVFFFAVVERWTSGSSSNKRWRVGTETGAGPSCREGSDRQEITENGGDEDSFFNFFINFDKVKTKQNKKQTLYHKNTH